MKLNGVIADKLIELIEAMRENELFAQSERPEYHADLFEMAQGCAPTDGEETIQSTEKQTKDPTAEKRPFDPEKGFNYKRTMARFCIKYADGKDMTEALYARYTEMYGAELELVNDMLSMGRALTGARSCAVTVAMLAAIQSGENPTEVKLWYRDLCADEASYSGKYSGERGVNARIMREIILQHPSTKKKRIVTCMASIRAYIKRQAGFSTNYAPYVIRGIDGTKPLIGGGEK